MAPAALDAAPAEILLLDAESARVLDAVAPGVFDLAVHPRWTRELLADPRHHLAVARDGGVVVGMCSALHYVHPDKAPQLWINEIGVAPTHRRRGIARALLGAMLQRGRDLGCTEAWLATEETNAAARALYETTGGEAEPCVLYAWPLTMDGAAARGRPSA